MSRGLAATIARLTVLTMVSLTAPVRAALAQDATAAVRADTAAVRFSVAGMTCGSCATTARLALRRLAGVYSAVVSYDSASAVVRYDPLQVNPGQIAQHLERMTGYRATPLASETATEPRPRNR